MSVTSTRTFQIGFSGDTESQIIQSALENIISPATIEVVELASGDNTVTSPIVPGVTVSAVTIIPPAGNLELIILKGVGGDTGIELHKTDPTSIAVNPTTTIGPLGVSGYVTFVLNAAADITGVRLIWS